MPIIISTSHLVGRRILAEAVERSGAAHFADLKHLNLYIREFGDAGAAVPPGFCIRAGARGEPLPLSLVSKGVKRKDVDQPA
eukprot:1636569-Pyramimonas_sp.AAC.1